MEELKHTSCANYESFLAENLQSFNQCSRINELQVQGTRIRACFNGWVILSSHPDRLLWSLWNPLTFKFIRLPPLVRDSHACCLLPLPGDQSLVFMLLSDKIPTIVFCRLDPNKKRKRLKWTEMSYAKQHRSVSGVDDCLLESPTCCNGKVYALALGTHYRSVIQVDFVVKGKEEVVISLVPVVKAPHTSPSSFHTVYSFLKGYCAKLFYIELVHFKDETRILEVRLFTLDMTSMTWEEMEDLKDDIFFLDLSSCSVFYKSAVASQIGGCVHILGAMDDIISFHVKERTMSPSSVPCIVRESQVLVWAMLECRLEADRPEAKQDQDTEVVIRSVNCDETEFDSTTSESTLLNIPFHILEMITEHCYGVETFMNFRATCKHCYLAAPLKRPHMNSPWLLVLRNDERIFSLIDPLCGDEYVLKTPRELYGHYNILCSRYGWLLLFKLPGCELVFCNPFTGKIRKLPATPCSLGSMCFSAPPTSPDCMVVGFTTRGPYHVYIHLMSQEPPSWCGYRLDYGTNDPYFFHFPTFSGRGDIYASCNNERIDAFRDIGKEDFSWEVVKDSAPCSLKTTFFLSKCDQHLLLVTVAEDGEFVEVFKLNDSTKEWEKINDLGKHMIYISETSCICLDAKSPQMGNMIYFPRYHGNNTKAKSPQTGNNIYFPRLLDNTDTKIVFYSLETCSYHTFDDKNIQQSFGANLFRTVRPCDPHTWIE
ncbi:hypothetical protein HanPSC8_Chr01g0035891 [Helianthus annuus]|nr:hypothetical protein HanLR1_Chr01g0031291 [Helianthus annuus]KAJ0958159.1 hypothetical protein HanPSC8_Chr01g0035891 [Helianthus annuus]